MRSAAGPVPSTALAHDCERPGARPGDGQETATRPVRALVENEILARMGSVRGRARRLALAPKARLLLKF